MTFSIVIVMFFGVVINKISRPATSMIKENTIIENKTIVKTDAAIKNEEKNIYDAENDSTVDWYIEIPKIDLYAPIEEGTDDEILNRSVGHFENTSRRNGNCGLAAHNRGYRVNFFARIKELEKGDIIYYFVDGKKYKYKVDEIMIIYETDWSILEETKDNRITLLTCVENREEYRLCVQAILVE